MVLRLIPAFEWFLRRFFPATWRGINAPEPNIAETLRELDAAIGKMQPEPNHSGSEALQ